MKTIGIILLGIVIAGMVSCSRSVPHSSAHNDDESLVTYENELFSVDIPNSWICDTSEWKGLDSLQNVVNIYIPNNNLVWFRFVKTFLNIWKNIDDAKQMAITSRALAAHSGENVELIHEIDSVEVGGYPASILYFANYVDNDTIIQKQFVTYLEDSHIVVYFNESFYVQNWEIAEKLGDMVIGTIKLKKVKNPLDNDSVFRKAVEEGLMSRSVEEKSQENARKVIEDIVRDKYIDNQ